MKSEEEYKQKILEEQMDFWFQGDAAKMVTALCSCGKVGKKEIQAIRGMLDELDD